MKSGWLYFDLTKSYFMAKGPFFITFEQLVDLDGRTVIALGYRDIMHLHPDWLKTDTVLIDNKKVITREFIPGKSDVPNTENIPGTFIGISNSKSVIQKYTCFIRQTSLGEWTKVPIVIAATVTVSGQFGETPDQSKEVPVLEIR